MVTASVRKAIRGVRGTPGEMILSVVLGAMTASRRMLQARYCGMRQSLHRKGSVLSSFSSVPWSAGVLPNSFAAPRNVVPPAFRPAAIGRMFAPMGSRTAVDPGALGERHGSHQFSRELLPYEVCYGR